MLFCIINSFTFTWNMKIHSCVLNIIITVEYVLKKCLKTRYYFVFYRKDFFWVFYQGTWLWKWKLILQANQRILCFIKFTFRSMKMSGEPRWNKKKIIINSFFSLFFFIYPRFFLLGIQVNVKLWVEKLNEKEIEWTNKRFMMREVSCCDRGICVEIIK